MDTFYCYDIDVLDETDKKAINSFEELFELQFKRCGIVADAGYGKSTFVHQMAREWTTGKNQRNEEVQWVKKFRFLFLFRIGEISSGGPVSLINLFQKVLPLHFEQCSNIATNSKCLPCEIAGFLKQETNLMDSSLFIFDGLDEKHVVFAEDVQKMLEGTGLLRYHVTVSSRQCDNFEALSRSPRKFLRLSLKGFTDDGVKSQLNKFGKLNVFGKTNELLKIPLYLTIACITSSNDAINFENCCAFVERFVDYSLRKCLNEVKILHNMKSDVILFLGLKALQKFAFIKMGNASDENSLVDIILDTPSIMCLAHAISCGLVNKNSSIDAISFVHQTIAEYCAAVYVVHSFKTNFETIDGIQLQIQQGLIDTGTSFSRMLSYMSHEYKEVAWSLSDTSALALLDEYSAISTKFIDSHDVKVYFPQLPITDAEKCTILAHLSFTSKLVRHVINEMWIVCGVFEDQCHFLGNAVCKKVNLKECKFFCDPRLIYDRWCPTSISFDHCEFGLCKDVVELPLPLEKLKSVELIDCTNDVYFVKALFNILKQNRCVLQELIVMSANATDELCKTNTLCVKIFRVFFCAGNRK